MDDFRKFSQIFLGIGPSSHVVVIWTLVPLKPLDMHGKVQHKVSLCVKSQFSHEFSMGFYGQSILCCCYTQFDVLKVFLEHMEGYALVMRYAWKMDFLKKILSFLGFFISKPSYFINLDAPFILCCLYTQFSIIKKF